MRLLSDYRESLDERKTEKKLLDRQIEEQKEKIAQREYQAQRLLKARWVLAEVARLTQVKFKHYIESLVTMAIKSVFDRPYKFLVDFEIKRNKSECLLRVQEGDWEPYRPKDDQGGSIIDPISLVLRPVLMSLQKPKCRNVMILDEPMKNMGDYLPLGAQMLREISHELGFQLIILTHEDELAEIADASWRISHNGEFSEIRQIKGKKMETRRGEIEL